MARYINAGFSFTAADQELVIPVNRWARCCFTLQIEGDGTVDLEGTIDQINRRDPLTGVPNDGTYATLNDDQGTPISDVGAGMVRTSGYALEAVKIISTDEANPSVSGRIMQQGEID